MYGWKPLLHPQSHSSLTLSVPSLSHTKLIKKCIKGGRQATKEEIDVVEETKKKCLFQNFKLMSSRRASFLFVLTETKGSGGSGLKETG